MNSAGSPGTPLEAIAERTGGRTAAAFELLGNETRLAILLALWDAYEVDPPAAESSNSAVSFSELFERVEYETTANFSYHLEKLEGHFLRKTDEGYELRQTGLNLVRTVLSGAEVDDRTVELTEIDWDCWLCGGQTAITYRHGSAYHVCTACEGVATHGGTSHGLLNVVNFDPAGLRGRTATELVAAAGVKTFRHVRTMQNGLCSACSGPVDASLERCEDHEVSGVCENCGQDQEVVAFFRCRVCKDYHIVPPLTLAVLHPAVVAFYYDHGVSLQWRADEFESVKRAVEMIFDHHRMEFVSRDPLRVAVTVAYGGEEIRLTYDETVSVVDVDR